MKRLSTWRARFGATVLVGAGAFLLLMVLDPWLGVLSVTGSTLDDAGTKGSLFSSLLTVAGLFLTVVLGMLAIVASMSDDRPVIRIMKQEMHNYDELVHRLVGPVFSLLILAVVAIVCLTMPSIAVDKLDADQLKAAHAARHWMTVLPSLALSISVGLFVQVMMIGRLIASVLLFKPRAPSPSDTHQASTARSQARREAAEAERKETQATDTIALGTT
jgi:hypothetical protein